MNNENTAASALRTAINVLRRVYGGQPVVASELDSAAEALEALLQPSATDQLAERVRAALRGIDQQQTDSDDGWWETSDGAKFGAERLAEVLAIVGDGA